MRPLILTLGVCLIATAASNSGGVFTLEEALTLSDKLSPEIQSANLRVLEAAARTGAVKSAYQPQAALVVSGGYQTSNLQGVGLIFPGFPSRVGPYRTFNARPQVTQTVIDLSLLQQIRASRVREAEAKAGIRTTREDLRIAVVQLYLEALAADSRAEAASARLATAEALLTQTRDKEQAGTASKLDVARGVEQAEAERAVLIDARRQGSEVKTMLVRTIGGGDLDPSSLRLAAPVIQAVSGDSGAGAERPEWEVIRQRQQAATLDVRAANAQRMPKLAAVGDYGLAGNGPDRSLSTYTVGATLTVPLWTGRRIESEVAEAKVRQGLIEQDRRRLQLQIDQEIRSARISAAAAREAVASAERGAAAARETLELARLRFQSGLATSVDTQVAQSQLALSDDTRIRAVYDLSLAEARLAKALGNLDAAFR